MRHTIQATFRKLDQVACSISMFNQGKMPLEACWRVFGPSYWGMSEGQHSPNHMWPGRKVANTLFSCLLHFCRGTLTVERRMCYLPLTPMPEFSFMNTMIRQFFPHLCVKRFSFLLFIWATMKPDRQEFCSQLKNTQKWFFSFMLVTIHHTKTWPATTF